MTREKFTPGPWRYVPPMRGGHGHTGAPRIESMTAVETNGEPVRVLSLWGAMGGDDVNADAHLIAAAPAMFAALEDIRDYVNSNGHTAEEVVQKMRRRASDALSDMWGAA